MQLRALVEIWPSETMVYIAELPGCVSAGSSADEALEGLPEAVEAHLSWLAGNGFVAGEGDVVIDIVEQLQSTDGRGPLFDADRVAVSAAELEHALRVGALARRDLIDVYRSVSGLRRTRRPDADAWSIAEHLTHVARLDCHYLAALENVEPAALAATLPDDPVAALQTSGALAGRMLTAWVGGGRGAVVVELDGEGWSAGKVIRRMTGHLREHHPWVLQLARG